MLDLRPNLLIGGYKIREICVIIEIRDSDN